MLGWKRPLGLMRPPSPPSPGTMWAIVCPLRSVAKPLQTRMNLRCGIQDDSRFFVTLTQCKSWRLLFLRRPGFAALRWCRYWGCRERKGEGMSPSRRCELKQQGEQQGKEWTCRGACLEWAAKRLVKVLLRGDGANSLVQLCSTRLAAILGKYIASADWSETPVISSSWFKLPNLQLTSQSLASSNELNKNISRHPVPIHGPSCYWP